MKATRFSTVFILVAVGLMALPSCKKDEPTTPNGGNSGGSGSFSLNCTDATHSGILFEGLAASGVTSEIPYSDGDGDTHNGQTVASTGVTGLSASIAAGNFADGDGTLTYVISGTPADNGEAYFALNIGGETCTISRNVEEIALAIGDTHQGGIVFYLDGSGGGLVAAPSDQSEGAEWGCIGIELGADGESIGTGYQNTNDILTSCSESGIAADICTNLSLNGYSDWFLPSIDELELMYQNLHLQGLGGFFTSNYYWSSTEDGEFGARHFNFFNGDSSTLGKFNTFRVRAVRAF